MKVNELRIGNQVHDPNHYGGGINIVIDEIRVTYETREWWDGLHPIPLTEEWLVKMGFSKKKIGRNNFNMVYNWTNTIDIIEYDNGEFYWDNSIMVKLEFIHQLQNLYFALTVEELKIQI